MQTVHSTIILVHLFPPCPGNIRCFATNVFRIQVMDCMNCTDRSLASVPRLTSTSYAWHAQLGTIGLSHSLDNVGQRFETTILDLFLHWWVSLFARTPASHLQWKTLKAKFSVATKMYLFNKMVERLRSDSAADRTFW